MCPNEDRSKGILRGIGGISSTIPLLTFGLRLFQGFLDDPSPCLAFTDRSAAMLTVVPVPAVTDLGYGESFLAPLKPELIAFVTRTTVDCLLAGWVFCP
jgi:hypothetical protein